MSANNFPKIKIDTGTIRRLLCSTTRATFTEDKSKWNDEKHIYMLDKGLELEFKEDEDLQNAWIWLLLQYCSARLNGEIFPIPQSFEEKKQEVLQLNDKAQSFIDEMLEITDNDNGRVGLQEMCNLWCVKSGARTITENSLRNNLREKLTWCPKKRHEGKQGCYVGVKVKGQACLIPKDDESLADTVENLQKALATKDEEIRQLKERIAELEKPSTVAKKVIRKIKKPITLEETSSVVSDITPNSKSGESKESSKGGVECKEDIIEDEDESWTQDVIAIFKK
jgi:hypothetical protein